LENKTNMIKIKYNIVKKWINGTNILHFIK
jgi:hypothetical protein